MDTSRWAQLLIETFPHLSSEDFEIVDDPTGQYNCIAYAAGDTSQWWWPNGIDYWPPWVSLNNSMESLKEAFAGLGYEPCDDGNVEDGCQKVVLYGSQERFEHAAVQMPNGRWRSKMGRGPVIEHRRPDALAGEVYGKAMGFMRRATNITLAQGT